MPETKPTQANVEEIRYEVENVNAKMNFLISKDKDAAAHVDQLIGSNRKLAQFYVMAKKPVSREEVAARLGVTPQRVSQWFNRLQGLLKKVLVGGEVRYVQSELEEALRLHQRLKRRFKIK